MRTQKHGIEQCVRKFSTAATKPGDISLVFMFGNLHAVCFVTRNLEMIDYYIVILEMLIMSLNPRGREKPEIRRLSSLVHGDICHPVPIDFWFSCWPPTADGRN